jgi:Ras-related protein Ral-A
VSFKVSILGTPGIGKSAIALRFSKSDFLNYYEATIEEEFEKRVTVQGVDVDVSILDTAGQEAFQALRSNWIVGRDGFILGFDAQNPVFGELFE